LSLRLAADLLMEIEIRLFQRQDSDQIAQLFHQTVREVNRRDYSSAQVKAWAPDDLYFRNWAEVCSQRFTYVAEQAGMIIGFGELEFDGHIDCFYCHKDYQNRGVGRKIYQAIESKGLEFGLERLFVEASVTAKPFFSRMGFLMIREQQVSCRGEIFTNYAMEKQLSSSPIAGHRP
jgi:putative acetyltransferase